MTWSAAKKKIAAMNAITITIIDEIRVSRLDGQVTRDVSVRTCCKKVNGLMLLEAIVSLF